MFYAILVLIHIVLAIGITSLLGAVMSRYDEYRKIGLTSIIAISLVTSLIAIPLTMGLFLLPPLNRLPGGMFEGGVMLTFPVGVIVFTIIFLCVNLFLVDRVSREKI